MLSVQVEKSLREFDLALAFEVRPAETLVIIGPSGCGKTTTLNLIAGLLRPDRGRIALGDNVLFDHAGNTDVLAERRHVGYVFQDFALFPHLTIHDNVAYGLRARRVASTEVRRRVRETLDLLGIAHLERHLPSALSGGERQRVALARAIACDAQILLLDEPLGSLDAQTRNRVRGELKDLLRLVSRIAIMVTHDYIDALTFGDQICVMDKGRLLQAGDRRQLLHHPKSRFVAELTGVNFYEGTIAAGRPDGMAEIWVGDSCLYAASNGPGMGDTLLAFFPSDVMIARERGTVSARNVFRSRIQQIIHMGDKVRLSLNGSVAMCAEITAAALEELDLKEGDDVFASVKATAVRTYR